MDVFGVFEETIFEILLLKFKNHKNCKKCILRYIKVVKVLNYYYYPKPENTIDTNWIIISSHKFLKNQKIILVVNKIFLKYIK